MNLRYLSFVFLIGVSVFFYGCAEGSQADRAADEIVRETENTLANVGTEIRRESNEFESKFKETRNNITTRMEAIERDMTDASETAKAEMQKELDKLASYRSKLDARMNRVGENMERGWNDFKGDLNKEWGEFSSASQQLLNDIERELNPEGSLD